MLDANEIQPSSSPWTSAPVLVRKKDGQLHWWIDFRCLNKEDRPKTAFITKYGLFEHKQMGFGLCNAPVTFQHVIQLALTGLTWKQALAYLDDVFMVGSCLQEHLNRIRMVLLRFRQHNLNLKPSKCALFQQSVKILGKLVSPEGVAMDPDQTAGVQNWPEPQSVRDVEAFLGFVNYHRAHLKNYAELSAPLYHLTGTKARKRPFEWTEDHNVTFEALKKPW